VSGEDNTSREEIKILGKYRPNCVWISSFNPSKLFVEICSNIKALKLPPKVGFRYLSF
jgi:hypothetical protein